MNIAKVTRRSLSVAIYVAVGVLWSDSMGITAELALIADSTSLVQDKGAEMVKNLIISGIALWVARRVWN